MIFVPPAFVTERLTLRRPALSDAEAIFRNYAQDPEVTRYLLWRPHGGVAETESFLRESMERWEEGTEFAWVITPRESDEAIGMIAVRPDEFKAELGYVLARSHWGKGLMTEAGMAVMDWLKGEPGIYRVWATCNLENGASARVLEKLGMQREGLLRRWHIWPNLSAEPQDAWMYARVR